MRESSERKWASITRVSFGGWSPKKQPGFMLMSEGPLEESATPCDGMCLVALPSTMPTDPTSPQPPN